MSPRLRRPVLTGAAIAAALLLAGCTAGAPFGGSAAQTTSGSPSGGNIVIGSAAFPESAIIAEVYAQALESKGIAVTRRFNIGQRELYLKALQDGSIDLIPEYSGNLLQYYDKAATASSSSDVYAQLSKKLPAGFTVLDESAAQDKDSENVTKAFSEKYHVTSISDLAHVPLNLTIAANPEFAVRPAGSAGLKRVYGVDVTLEPISDSGGPLTIRALTSGSVQVADIFTTSPAIKANDLVTLKDPKNLILAQNVLPLINSMNATPTVSKVLNEVSHALTTSDLIEFNSESSGATKATPATIAKRWLAGRNL
ncbi:ABC transporter substrate-binding protein [Leifsonia sp. L25]|uniref:ABC transporter substrate-binding protein n=1 Tax=Leifsonia sp. L25 TaxID=3423957 RepID=UPI003D68106E